MAPVATNTERAQKGPDLQALKEDASKVFNPFYSPSIGDDGDASYKYAEFKVRIFYCRQGFS
jgi:sulfonate dioxygenase